MNKIIPLALLLASTAFSQVNYKNLLDNYKSTNPKMLILNGKFESDIEEKVKPFIEQFFPKKDRTPYTRTENKVLMNEFGGNELVLRAQNMAEHDNDTLHVGINSEGDMYISKSPTELGKTVLRYSTVENRRNPKKIEPETKSIEDVAKEEVVLFNEFYKMGKNKQKLLNIAESLKDKYKEANDLDNYRNSLILYHVLRDGKIDYNKTDKALVAYAKKTAEEMSKRYEEDMKVKDKAILTSKIDDILEWATVVESGCKPNYDEFGYRKTEFLGELAKSICEDPSKENVILYLSFPAETVAPMLHQASSNLEYIPQIKEDKTPKTILDE